MTKISIENMIQRAIEYSSKCSFQTNNHHVAVLFSGPKVISMGHNGFDGVKARHAEVAAAYSAMRLSGLLGIGKQCRTLWGVQQPCYEKRSKEYPQEVR